MKDPVNEKPLLRGKLHLYAALAALGAGVWLTLHSSSREAMMASAIYSVSLVSMFAISALYHIPTWPPETRLRLRRLDHSAIFLLIAGTATPLFVLGLFGPARTHALTLMWAGAGLGVLQSIFWVRAPKALVAMLCVGLGWLGAPYFRLLTPLVGFVGSLLLITGGLAYSLGALVYSLRKPNPKPGVFGYHEVFHTLVVLAAGLHYISIFNVITKAGK